MKVGIITFHRANNYGAVLQAFALAKVASKFKGIEAKIIDYKRSVDDERYSPIYNKKVILEKPTYNIIRYIKFEHFRRSFLPLSDHILSIEDFKKVMHSYDVGIWGSDQVWNKNIYAKADEEIFFGRDIKTKKVAYAPSTGSCDTKWYTSNIEDLQEYKEITVRDSASKVKIEKLIERNVEIVPDPVFLLSPKEWLQFVKKRNNCDDYVLYYEVYTDDAYKMAKKAANKLQLPLVVVSNVKFYNDENTKNIADCGPLDLLNLIYYAKVVYTNSFHGTAFSLIFKKDFYCFDFGVHKGDNRKKDLLCEYGVESRIINTKSLSDVNKDAIDYNRVHELYRQKRVYGLTMLKKMLYS